MLLDMEAAAKEHVVAPYPAECMKVIAAILNNWNAHLGLCDWIVDRLISQTKGPGYHTSIRFLMGQPSAAKRRS